MFFLSGVMITVAATFVVVYNSDMILSVLTRFGRGLGALAPSIKMAVAYPLANKMRTGLTMAMFTLVVFALTVMSSMNHNFQRALPQRPGAGRLGHHGGREQDEPDRRPGGGARGGGLAGDGGHRGGGRGRYGGRLPGQAVPTGVQRLAMCSGQWQLRRLSGARRGRGLLRRLDDTAADAGAGLRERRGGVAGGGERPVAGDHRRVLAGRGLRWRWQLRPTGRG